MFSCRVPFLVLLAGERGLASKKFSTLALAENETSMMTRQHDTSSRAFLQSTPAPGVSSSSTQITSAPETANEEQRLQSASAPPSRPDLAGHEGRCPDDVCLKPADAKQFQSLGRTVCGLCCAGRHQVSLKPFNKTTTTSSFCEEGPPVLGLST